MKGPLTCPQCGRTFPPPAIQCSVDGSALYGPEARDRVGRRLGNYELDRIIGVGGMGVVYRGKHVMLDKPVAVKVLGERFAARQGGVEQFLREAQAATRTRHPNVVDVTDFGTAPDGAVYFVMEYLEGISLEDVLARDGYVPLFKAVNIVRQIAHALAAAHEQGIVHRDLKPENIFLINREGRRRVVRRIREGGNERFVVELEENFDFVKLFDFGVAKYTLDDRGPSSTTQAGMVFGTPQYMSPEHARGEPVDGRSDVYSLGVLFYEMVTGRLPFDGEHALEILHGHVSGIVIPPSQRAPHLVIDPGTDRTIVKCLAKRPEDRFQTMDELVEALADCFTDQVFLRDADRMPGAAEAGIVVPNVPPPLSREKGSYSSSRHKSITEDLSELFAGSANAERLEEIMERDKPAPTPSVPVPLEHPLSPKAPTPDASPALPRQRRITDRGMGSFGGKNSH